jgi:hypothetical protein
MLDDAGLLGHMDIERAAEGSRQDANPVSKDGYSANRRRP